MRSAAWVSLSLRSAAMALALLAARVWRRLGIIAPRSGVDSVTGGSPCHRVAVGWHSWGNWCLLPGYVVYVCPVGAVHTTVPSGSWRSRQPLAPFQNVFSRWWRRSAKGRFSGDAQLAGRVYMHNRL